MRVRRIPVQDEYAEGPEMAVLQGGNVLVLSPLATSVLSMLDDTWVGSCVIASELEESYGAPPEGSDLVSATRNALHTLADLGLVEVEQRSLG